MLQKPQSDPTCTKPPEPPVPEDAPPGPPVGWLEARAQPPQLPGFGFTHQGRVRGAGPAKPP